MRQLRRWKRLWRRSLTRSHKRTSMGPSRSYWNGTTSGLQPEKITTKGTRVSCVYCKLKCPYEKKSLETYFMILVYIYIYIYISFFLHIPRFVSPFARFFNISLLLFLFSFLSLLTTSIPSSLRISFIPTPQIVVLILFSCSLQLNLQTAFFLFDSFDLLLINDAEKTNFFEQNQEWTENLFWMVLFFIVYIFSQSVLTFTRIPDYMNV